MSVIGCASNGVKHRDNTGGFAPLPDGTKLAITKIVAPEYPVELRKARIEGVVYVRFSIKPDGTPTNLAVLQSPNEALNAPAVKAVSEWRFESYDALRYPAVNIKVPVRFTVDK